jgi:hypothetical protein
METYFEEITDNQSLPTPVIIQAGDMLVLSKTNAFEFHQKMREMIMDSGYGLFEYLEVLKFFENVNKFVKGDSQAKIPEDSEFIKMVRDELAKYEKGKFTTTRGVRFELAETGTSYDFTGCNDEELNRLEAKANEAKLEVKQRQDFLKTVKVEGLIITDGESGETYTVYPPVKKSKSSYKITLEK